MKRSSGHYHREWYEGLYCKGLDATPSEILRGLKEAREHIEAMVKCISGDMSRCHCETPEQYALYVSSWIENPLKAVEDNLQKRFNKKARR